MTTNSTCLNKFQDGALWESVGVICTLAGFFLLAVGEGLVGFTVSLCGQISWLVWAKMKGAHGILLVNFVLLITSMVGIFNH